jgi:dihydrofolate synthase/folylpolyglutamate synthase
MSPYERYLDAERSLNEGLIRLERSLAHEHLPVSDPVQKMAVMRAFLDACGNPQKNIPALHVAGTSGKGSVCAAAAGILSKAGFRVGLHVSPYLQAALEKTWVDGQLVSANDFSDAVDFIVPIAKQFLQPDTPGSIHGMASVGVALELFRRKKVDLMVFEVGCGGRFDLSSFVETAVAVVTNVGLDHLRTLGPGIEQIAWHKAGVARSGAPLICGAAGIAREIVREEAIRVGAPFDLIEKDADAFSHNRQIARVAARRMAEILGRDIDETTIDAGQYSIPLPGRSEHMPGAGPLVILDGAHNADKLAAAVNAAMGAGSHSRKVCLFGVLGAKVGPAMAASLRGRFDHIVVTEPSVYGKPSSPAEVTAEMLADACCSLEIVKDPQAALSRAMLDAGASGTVLATGSFYLVGSLRERFFPKEQVVLQRTSFPS